MRAFPAIISKSPPKGMNVAPRFRRDTVFGSSTAHAEGWALYRRSTRPKRLVGRDATGHLGASSQRTFPGAPLVVDTGLHAKHWTRHQAIDYVIGASEGERTSSIRASRASYKAASWKILRGSARRRDVRSA